MKTVWIVIASLIIGALSFYALQKTFFPPETIEIENIKLITDSTVLAKYNSLQAAAELNRLRLIESESRIQRLLKRQNERNKEIDAYVKSDVRAWLNSYESRYSLRTPDYDEQPD